MSYSERKYLEAVMEDFFIKRKSEYLYIYLNNPSPENIKSLALNILKYEGKLNKEDSNVINGFLNFNPKQLKHISRSFEELVQDISTYKKYKRISQFINRYQENISRDTSIINIEFIAWLIDFKSRPSSNYIKEFYPDDIQHISRFSNKNSTSKEKKYPKSISKLEIKKEDLEELLVNFDLPKFKKTLGTVAQQQLQLMLEEWKEKELKPLFENLVEERLIKLEKKIQYSKRLYRRLGFMGLIFSSQDNQLLFEENLFTALEDYQVDISNNNDIDDSLLESISDLGN